MEGTADLGGLGVYEGNTEMCHKKISKGVGWIHLAQHRDLSKHYNKPSGSM